MNIKSQTEKIYSCLKDDMSRKIYENRLLHSLLSDNHKYYSEFIKNICILDPLVEKFYSELKGKNVILYGCGQFAQYIMIYWSESMMFGITAFCDSNDELWGTEFNGYNVISPNELKEKYLTSIVVITPVSKICINEIADKLMVLGFKKEQILVYRSIFKYDEGYFEKDILHTAYSDEIFVDAGCLDFKSSFNFVEWCSGKYKKIIAFEPNPDQFPVCADYAESVKNAVVYPYGLWHENAEVWFDNARSSPVNSRISDKNENTVKINAVSLDGILDGEEVTFIKMDVEGAELNALKGAERTILKYRPKLAICVYHKPEDIWEIPDYILSLHSDYKLYLRHYSSRSTDTVLYAI